ncbi:MAG: tyrosine-type recombinase/integrase [Desulfitobacterium sp.]
MASHNLGYQFQSAIDSAFRPGLDKHAAKHTGESMDKVCSFNEKKNLQEVSYQLAMHIKEHYPEIKMVKDIKPDHIQGYLNQKSRTCSTATLKNFVSRIKKIEILCQRKFKTSTKWKDNILAPQSHKTVRNEKLRIQTMEKKDLDKILDYGYRYSKSKAIVAIDLAYRYGLRDAEIANLKVKNVNWEMSTLEVIGKGGRRRELTIKLEDTEFMKTLCENKKSEDRLIGIRKDSISKQLNRIMEKLNLKKKYPVTGIHAIRKLKAQELWDLKRAQGFSKKEAMDYVSNYLGHGKGRYDVLNTYVQTQN